MPGKNTKRGRNGLAVVALAVAAWVPVGARGAAFTWNGSSSNSWDVTSNWTHSGGGSIPQSNSDVSFPAPVPGTGAAIALSTGEVARTLSFNDNYTLSGGDLTVNTIPQISVTSGKTVTASTVLLNTTGLLHLTGGGTLLPVNTGNTYTGNWQVDGGTLEVGSANELGSGTTTLILSGGALQLDNMSLSRGVSMNAGAILRGTGTASTVTGTITLTNGANVTLATGASASDTLILGGGTNSLTGGTTTVAVTGSGTVQLNNASDFIGSWSINSGNLQIDQDSELGNFGNGVTINGGALVITNNITSSRLFTIGPSGGTINIPFAFDTFNSGLIATTGSLTKTGLGTLSLPTVSARTGSTLINQGEITVHNGAALGSGPITLTATGSDSGVLEVNNVTVNQPLNFVNSSGNSGLLIGNGNASYTGTITVAANTHATLAAQPGATLTIGDANNDITGGNASSIIDVIGSDLVSLPFANNYAGSWNLFNGTLRVGNAGSIGSGNFNSYAGVLEIAGANLSRAVTLHDQATIKGTGSARIAQVDVASASTVYLGTGSSPSDVLQVDAVTGTFPSSVRLNRNGSGMVILSSANSFAGDWYVEGGTVWAQNPLAFGGSQVPISGVLQFGNGGTMTNNLVLISGSTIRAPFTYQESGDIYLFEGTETADVAGGAILTLSGNITGSGNLVKTGAGTLVTTGTVNTTGSASIGSGSSMAIAGGSLSVRSIIDNGSLSVSSGTVNLTTLAAGNDGTLTGGNGTGTISLTGGTIFAGTVLLGSTSGGSATMTVGNSVSFRSDRLSTNDFVVNGGTVTIEFPDPAPETDAVLNGSIVGGYLRDGAIQVHGGSVTATAIKLGVTSGQTGTYTQDGGTVTVATFGVGNDGTPSAGAGAGVATISGGMLNAGSLVFGSTAAGSGTMTLVAGANLTLKTALISFNGTNFNASRLNLTNNRLVIATTPTGSWNGSIYTGVTGMVQSGRNGGSWNGSGIVTSLTQATTSNLTSIAVARASDARPSTATATTVWAGQTITGTDTLVMYTYGGDATLDGKINIDDYVRIDSGIASGLTGWSNGDFNYDGKINIDDYTTVIDANIGNQNGFVFPTGSGLGESISGVAVPEPTLIGLSLGGTALFIRRRRPAASGTS